MNLRTAVLLLTGLVLLPGCGKKLDQQVRQAVSQFDGLDLPEKQVEILEIRESGDYAIAELRVSTAVKLKQEGGRWVIDEIRLGDRRWEKASTVLAALRAQREADTRQSMRAISEAIGRYRSENGRLPEVESFEELSDLLTPRYLPQLIRLDGWSHAFSLKVLSPQSLELRSAGPDGALDTEDDLVAVEGSSG